MFGLFDSGGQSQMPGQAQQNPLQRLLDPQVALPMAAALMGNQGNMQNFGNAFAAGGQGMAQQKELQAQTAQKNKTVEFFRQQAPEYAAMIDAGMPVNDAFKLYTEQRYAKQADPYKVVGGQVFNTQDQSWIEPPESNGPPETGLSPLMMRDKNGNTIYVQPTRDGQLVPSKGPEGFEPYDPYSKAFETGSGSAAGKARGEDAALYDSVNSKMPGLESVIVKLDRLAEKATYTQGGQLLDAGRTQLGMEPRDAAIARTEYKAVVDNQVLPMLRDTFGAAFTVAEGESLRATLGAPDKTPQEKQAVLRAFIEQKRRDLEALGARTGQGPQPGQSGDVSTMSDEELEAIVNGR